MFKILKSFRTDRCVYNKLLNFSSFNKRNFSSYNSSKSVLSVTKDEETQTAKIILQNPPVNTFNLEVVQELTTAIKNLEQEKCKAIVFTSKYPPVFSAGLDIMEMYNPKRERLELFWKSLQEMWKTVYRTPLVTIAAINGHTAAGGCMLCLSCDYRIMIDSKAAIGYNETALGLSVPPWFRDLLVNVIGVRRAEKAFFFGTLFTPKDALDLNIVDELASSNEELEAKVQEQLKTWLKIPSAARKALKSELRQPLISKLESYQDEDLRSSVEYIMSPGVQKGLAKYMELLKAKKN